MPAQRGRKISENEWRTHHQTLKQLRLHEKKPLEGENGIIVIMERAHNFFASKSQYEARFKKLRWTKNHKGNDWKRISNVVYGRDRQGKDSEVYINGILQKPEKVRKEIARYNGLRLPQLSPTSPPQLPEGFTVRSPILNRTMSLTVDLPFHVLEKSLRTGKARSCHQSPAKPASSFVQSGVDPMLCGSDAEDLYPENSIARIERRNQHISVDTPGIFQTLSGTWTASSSVLAALKLVVPEFIAEEGFPSSSTIFGDVRAFASPLYRQVLFSIANNFAGLGALDSKSIIRFLQEETDQMLYKLILNNRDYSSRAITQNLFKVAIEAGDARIVDLLLIEGLAGINVNQQFCSIGGQKYTPIERASALRHKEVIRSLLKHHADVNRTHPESSLDGALDYAIGGCWQGAELDPEIFQMLLGAGGDLSSGQLSHIIGRKEGEFAALIISKNAPKHFTSWSKNAIFLKAIEFLDEQKAIKIIDMMLNVGADLNFSAAEKSDSDHRWPRRVIDVAAQRGSLTMVELLFKEGALLSDDTFPFAVQSGKKDLVNFLLQRGADVNSGNTLDHQWLHRAIDVAAQSGSLEMVELLLNGGALLSSDTLLYAIKNGNEDLVNFLLQSEADVDSGNTLDRPWPHWAINIAAQSGSFRMVELLLNGGVSLSGDTFPCAVASGNEDLIHFLLKRGADINSIGSQKITALSEAIRLQNTRIFGLLREGGAKWDDEERFSAALTAASEMGDVAFTKDLIQLKMGTPDDLGYALTTAIRGGFDEVATMLIDAGANTNFGAPASPLEIVLLRREEPRNVALVYALLDADADPNFHPIGFNTKSAIQLAVQWGNRSVVETLLFAGAAVNVSNNVSNNVPNKFSYGNSFRGPALRIAVKDRHYDLVQLLLDAGADMNDCGEGHIGGSALKAAAANGDMRMVHLLLDRGADPHDPGAFQEAFLGNGDMEMIHLLLDRGAGPHDSGAFQEAFLKNRELFGLLIDRHKARYPMGRKGLGSTQLAVAIEKGDESLVKALLEIRGSGDEIIRNDRGAVSPFGFSTFKEGAASPFGFSIFKEGGGAAGFTELFLLKDYCPNSIVSEIRQGYLSARITAFLAAIGTGSSSTVELLIRYGADINLPARGRVKRTPLQRAVEIGSREIVELLIDHGANVNAPAAARSGGTALQLAAIGGYFPIACILLDRGADVDAPTSKVNGRTALEGAAENGRLDMVQILLNKGAGCNGKDQDQFARAKALADDNEHFSVVDLLESRINYYDDLIDWDWDGN